jgi:hypothetical protein
MPSAALMPHKGASTTGGRAYAGRVLDAALVPGQQRLSKMRLSAAAPQQESASTAGHAVRERSPPPPCRNSSHTHGGAPWRKDCHFDNGSMAMCHTGIASQRSRSRARAHALVGATVVTAIVATPFPLPPHAQAADTLAQDMRAVADSLEMAKRTASRRVQRRRCTHSHKHAQQQPERGKPLLLLHAQAAANISVLSYCSYNRRVGCCCAGRLLQVCVCGGAVRERWLSALAGHGWHAGARGWRCCGHGDVGALGTPRAVARFCARLGAAQEPPRATHRAI